MSGDGIKRPLRKVEFVLTEPAQNDTTDAPSEPDPLGSITPEWSRIQTKEIRVNHVRKEFKCDKCDYSSGWHTALVEHKKSHWSRLQTRKIEVDAVLKKEFRVAIQ